MSETNVRSIDIEYAGPIALPQYEARLSVTSTGTDATVISVTVTGSSRIIDQVLHAATDAFREEVER